MQSKIAFLLFSVMAPSPATSLRNGGGVRGASRMQPQVVAVSLAKMEDEWRSQAQLWAECNATTGSGNSCLGASNAFEKSCGTVVNAVKQASSGDRSAVGEYMGVVCGQTVLEGWRKERCQSLASTITGAMSADNYENREDLDSASLCKSYWSRFVSEEVARVAKERADEEAARVKHEAEQKKLEAKRAEEAKKAAEEAAAQEKVRKAEEATRLEAQAKKKAAEEKVKAAEEKVKAEKEAAQLKAKEEEALHKADEAKQRMEKARAAAASAAEASRVATEKAAKASKVNVVSNASAPKVSANATKAITNATKTK